MVGVCAVDWGPSTLASLCVVENTVHCVHTASRFLLHVLLLERKTGMLQRKSTEQDSNKKTPEFYKQKER